MTFISTNPPEKLFALFKNIS